MKQVMNYHKDNGLLNMIRRTDPMINDCQKVALPLHSTLCRQADMGTYNLLCHWLCIHH